ncbi:MAG: hypothetical protein AAF414_15425 [Pseudomonadota bacterium]
MTKRLLLLGFASLTVISMASWPGSASAQSVCEPFDVVSNQDLISFVDHQDEGVTPGDMRILRWQISDLDGVPVAEFHVTTTVMHSDVEDAHPVSSDGTMVFDEGTLRVSTFIPLRDPSDTTASSVSALEWSVIGGTGVFSHASGTMTTTPNGQGVYDHAFEIHCPG